MLDLLLNREKLLSNPKALGRWGERQAEKLLKSKGLKTLTRNFSSRAGELDIVMVAPDRSIVFVEVKTRRSEDFAAIETAITTAKKKRMTTTARYFLASLNIENRPYRFDVVTVTLPEKDKPDIRHYPSAFVA